MRERGEHLQCLRTEKQRYEFLKNGETEDRERKKDSRGGKRKKFTQEQVEKDVTDCSVFYSKGGRVCSVGVQCS